MDYGGKRNHESRVNKQSTYVEMKLRQRLREESVELRELESKLRTAYVNKELCAQLAEKEAEKLAKQYREEVAVELMRKKWLEDEEAAKEWKKYQAEGKAQYHMELCEQEEGKRHAAYKDFLREKILIDEIVQRIHEEDQREQEEVMLKKRKTKHDMDEFRRCQEIWKKKEHLALEEENRRIIQFLRDKEDFNYKIHVTARKRDEVKAAVTKTLMDIIKEKEDKRREHEEAHQLVLEEERRIREEGEVELRVREALARRQEARMAQEWERQHQMERLSREAQEEAGERQKLLEQMAESERLEQMTRERRQWKKAEHREAVEALLEERRQCREHQMAALREDQLKVEGEEEARQLVIEHERLQILREHATKLIGYLPKGVLREDDLPLFWLEATSKGSADCVEGKVGTGKVTD